MSDTSETGKNSAPDADEPASPAGKPKVAGMERFAFLWKALSFVLVAMLIAAAAAFVWRRELLTQELQEHYARTAARQARELELAFENYRQVIVNLTRIAETTGQVAQEKVQLQAATARVVALSEAKEKVQQIALATKRTEKNAAERRNALARDVDELGNQTTQLDAKLRAAQSKVTDAKQALDKARTTAAQAVKDAADALKQAELDAQLAAKDVTDNPLDRPPAAPDPAASAVQQQEPTDGATKQAKQTAIEAAVMAERKQQAAQQAEAELRRAEQRYDEALSKALRAYMVHMFATDQKKELEQKLRSQREENARLNAAARALKAQEEVVLSKLRLAAQEVDTIVAVSASLGEGILPSYHAVVNTCVEQNPESVKDAKLCSAREMARRGEVSKASRPFEVVACPPGLPPHGQASLTADGKSLIFSPPGAGALSACGQVPLLELLSPVGAERTASIGSSRSFDELLLMRPDGTIIAQASGSSSVRLVKMPGLGAERVVASQVKAEVALGAQKYRAFMQPVAVTMAAGCATGDCAKIDMGSVNDVVLCGLVEEDRLFGESLEVSPGFFLWTLVLLCFGVLAVPLAKLWFVGPTSRFRRFDVALLAISALAATFLTVILVLATTNYFGLRDRLDTQLSDVGGAAVERMQAALATAKQQVEAYRESTKELQASIPGASEKASISRFQEVCSQVPKDHPLCKVSALLKDPGLTRQGDRWSVCEQVQCTLGTATEGDVIAFVSDRDGNQWVRSVAGAHAPNPVNIAQRTYFTQAVRREGCLAGSGDAPCITAEVVRSNAIGEVVLVAASPIQANGPHSSVQGVAGVARRIRAFENAILPLGLELAIIDGEGRIMVHSDRESRQGQSLVHDFDKPQELLAAMNAGMPDTMTRRYRGEVVRLHMQPIPETGWYVLVMGSRGIVDVITADIVGLTLVGFGALIGCCLVGLCFLALLVWCLRRRRKPSPVVELLSLRPNPAQRAAYGFSGAAMMSAGVVLSAGCLFLEVPTLPALALALGAATIGVMVVPGVGLLARYLADGSSLSRWLFLTRLRGISLRSAYSLCCFGLGLVLVVLPTVVIFEASRDHMLDTLGRAEQRAYLKGDAAGRCLDAMSDAQCNRVFRPGTVKKPDRELKGLREASCWLWPTPCLADLLPVLGPNDGAWNGREYRDPGWKRGAGILVRGGVATPIPLLPSLQPRYFLVGMLCLFVLGILAFSVTRASAARLLMIGVLERLELMRSEDGAELPDEPGSLQEPRRYLVLGATPEVQAKIRKRYPSALVVAIDEFLRTPGEIAKLEQLLQAPAELIVLLSQREPMRQVIASEVAPEIAARWAMLLERFQTVHAPIHTVSWTEGKAGEVSRARLVSLWSECTKDEKRLLAQLAIEGYINPNPQNREAVMDLARRGLIDANTLTLSNRPFGEFIANSVSSKQFAHWEEEDGGSAYRALRMPLLLAVVLILGVVLVVNPSLAALGPLVPALAGSLPKMLQIVATMFTGEAGLGD